MAPEADGFSVPLGRDYDAWGKRDIFIETIIIHGPDKFRSVDVERRTLSVHSVSVCSEGIPFLTSEA